MANKSHNAAYPLHAHRSEENFYAKKRLKIFTQPKNRNAQVISGISFRYNAWYMLKKKKIK